MNVDFHENGKAFAVPKEPAFRYDRLRVAPGAFSNKNRLFTFEFVEKQLLKKSSPWKAGGQSKEGL